MQIQYVKKYNNVVQKIIVEQKLKIVIYFRWSSNKYRKLVSSILFVGHKGRLLQILKNKKHSAFYAV